MNEPHDEPRENVEPPAGQEATSGWPWLRIFLLRAIGVVGAVLLVSLFAFASSAWYTSRSQFCRSCHIMEPYYVSWEKSAHADVACIKCHFPPGVGEKVRGKMLGLVQLAKYVTETQGPQPDANVPDASCLRSGCHETQLLPGRIDFHGVPFDHGPHMKELRNGKKLRCTSCHSQTDQREHMAVLTSTCFLCHFNNTPFNEGVGACTHCHQIPDQEYDLGGGVKFNHNLAYERGVACVNCHGDVIQGTGEVSVERCQLCHNRTEDLERINESVFLHESHTAHHKVECFACHMEIRHSLDPHSVATAASDCRSCHPNQHQEQTQLLLGTGARSVPATRNAMNSARLNCHSCHRDEQVSLTGAVLLKASMQTCTTCHDPTNIEKLQQYSQEVNQVVVDLQASFPTIRNALRDAEMSQDEKEKLRAQLEDLEHDIAFLSTGNGIHNIHFSSVLTRTVTEKLRALCDVLNIDPPDVTLPDALEASIIIRDPAAQD